MDKGKIENHQVINFRETKKTHDKTLQVCQMFLSKCNYNAATSISMLIKILSKFLQEPAPYRTKTS